MSKKAFDIFFAVGAPSHRSSLWRAWGTNKGDVCLTNCEVNSDFKLTIHPPNERHTAIRCHQSYKDPASLKAAESGTHPLVVMDKLPDEFAKAKTGGYGRFDDVWEPQENAPGLVLAFKIGMPDSELRPLRREVLARRDVHWLPAPGDARIVEVGFMIASVQIDPNVVPGSHSVGNQLLFRHEFSKAWTLMIVWRVRDLSQEEQMWVIAYRLSVLPPSDAARENIAMFDYHRVVVDIRDDASSLRAFIDTAVE